MFLDGEDRLVGVSAHEIIFPNPEIKILMRAKKVSERLML